jgi:uncharacterized protein
MPFTSTPVATDISRPLPEGERIAILDVVRGFALLGIFVMNIPGFSTSYYAGADGSHAFDGTLDRIAYAARDMLVSGKFNSMFSLLFAIGFTIQFGRMQMHGEQLAMQRYLRRLAALLAFGVIHVAVFWTGDVLHIYAVLGFILLGLRNTPDKTIVAMIVACLAYAPVMATLNLLGATPESMQTAIVESQGWEASNNAAYGHGSFIDAAREHTREFIYFYDNAGSLSYTLSFYVQMFTTMLIGLLIGRHRLMERLDECAPRLRQLQPQAFAFGIFTAVVYGAGGELLSPTEASPLGVLVSTSYVLCRLALTTFYVVSIALLFMLPQWHRRFAPIALAGRMPLTNYLLQTAFGTWFFYGWGLGYWGRLGPALELLLAPAFFFLIQVPLSMWWMGRYRYGPMEYVWRMLTYGRAALVQDHMGRDIKESPRSP